MISRKRTALAFTGTVAVALGVLAPALAASAAPAPTTSRAVETGGTTRLSSAPESVLTTRLPMTMDDDPIWTVKARALASDRLGPVVISHFGSQTTLLALVCC